MESKMAKDWEEQFLRLGEFMDSVDPAKLSHFRKGLSFATGHVLSQTGKSTWEEMKRAAFDEDGLSKVAELAREWRGDRTPDTPMYWAYEIVAISLECAASNEPFSSQCEQLADGIIGQAIREFPIPNSKSPTGDIHTTDRVSSLDEEASEKKPNDNGKNVKFIIEKGSLLDTTLKSDDIYADMGILVVEGVKKLAELENASQNAKDNWKTIRNWLEVDIGAELGPDDHLRIKKAYKAYMAIGIAPSLKMAAQFEEASKHYKAEGYDSEPDRPPKEVMKAFDQMLSTDEEISEKKTQDEGQKPPILPSKPSTEYMASWKLITLIGWGMLSLLVLIAVANANSYIFSYDYFDYGDFIIRIVGPFFLLSFIGWMVYRYIPNQLTPYIKKTIAIALIWIMAVGTWMHFFGKEFFYEYSDKDYMGQFIFFPPVLIIIAAILWRWASRTPHD